MGGKQREPGTRREIVCPRGVKLREFATEQRIQVAFSFKGVECRELLSPRPITQTTINLAGGLRAEIQNKIAAGTFHYPDYFPDSPRAAQFDMGGRRILVSKLLQAQLTIYEAQVENGKLSPSTLEGYRKAIDGERYTFWADMTLADATPSKLRDWIGGMRITAKTARNILTPLRSMFEDALNDELIVSNPFDRIALNKLLRQTTTASEYEVDPFDAAERKVLLDACRADEWPLMAFWLNAGLRPGELIALRWDRIDWVHQKARIDLNRVSGVTKDPKTAAGVRDVELNADAIAALIAQKKFTFLAGEQVFHNPRAGEPWGTDAQLRKTLWLPLCKRAGVRYRNPYQCRHTYASSMLTAGENPWYVAQQLGHADVQMVFRVYGKFIAADYQKPKALNIAAAGGEA
jgi:integrase